GLGYRTVIRICGRLESLGIIRQYAMKRASDMQQTSNAIVIIPPVHSKSGRQENEKVADQKNNISLKQKHNINHLNVKHSGYIKFVPKALQQFKAFFGLNIKDMYGRVWLAAKKLGVNADQASMQRVGFNVMESIKSFIKKSGTMISPDEQRAMAYVIAYEQIKQGVEKGSIYDMSYMYAFLEKVKKMRAMESRTKQEPF
ncbi:hypothetical protein, partial [Mesorhizobium sp. M7A.F.Ca.MR.362.00.0.0]|uniref:hypothetical protein n=1 Tax=Mesorhizobium sp. M7A.F.Ca.MR.362.00.0.0 TaxID=2496779 RepID=UPI0019D48FC6